MKPISLRWFVVTSIWMVFNIGGGQAGAVPPRMNIFAGPGPGGSPKCYRWTLHAPPQLPFAAFPYTVVGGVRVAVGDVNGDGQAEIIAGSGGGPHVRVFNGRNRQVILAFDIQDPAFAGGVYVAADDTTGDGTDEIVVGAGPGGGPHVEIRSSTGQRLAGFSAYEESFSGGVRVAAGDVNGDGKADIITGAGPGGGPHVKVFDGATGAQIASFMAYPGFTGGVYVAAGWFNSDNFADIVVSPDASPAGGVASPPVHVYSGAGFGLLSSVQAFPSMFQGGGRVAVGDLNADGIDDLAVDAEGAGGPHVTIFNGKSMQAVYSVAVHDSTAPFACFPAIGKVDGDTMPDLVFGSGPEGGPFISILEPTGSQDEKEPEPPTARGGVRVAQADVDGNGVPDLIMAGVSNVVVCPGDNVTSLLGSYPPFGATFTGGVNGAGGDVNGDGKADVIAAVASGAPPSVRVYDSSTTNLLHNFMAFDTTFAGGVWVAAGDVNGDGRADIVAASGQGQGPMVKIFSGNALASLGSFMAYPPAFTGGVFVASGDLNGDGMAEVVTGPGTGGTPQVKVFDGRTGAELKAFLAYDATFLGGVRVAVGDVDGDSRPDIITGPGPGTPGQVRFFDGRTSQLLGSYLALPATFLGGVFVGSATPPAPRVELRHFMRMPSGAMTFTVIVPKGREGALHRSTDGGGSWEEVESRPGSGLDQIFNFTSTEPNVFFRAASR